MPCLCYVVSLCDCCTHLMLTPPPSSQTPEFKKLGEIVQVGHAWAAIQMRCPQHASGTSRPLLASTSGIWARFASHFENHLKTKETHQHFQTAPPVHHAAVRPCIDESGCGGQGGRRQALLTGVQVWCVRLSHYQVLPQGQQGENEAAKDQCER